MALIIEDGSVVSGANSFVTDTEYVDYAAARGLTIGTYDGAREIELIKAMDYFLSVETGLKGTRVNGVQTLPYPRENLYVRNFFIPSDEIPDNAKFAQMEAAAASNDQELLTNASQNDIKREKLGPLESEFFEGGGWTIERTERVDAALAPLMNSRGFGRTGRAL